MLFQLIFVDGIIVCVDAFCVYYILYVIHKIKKIAAYNGETNAVLIGYEHEVVWYRTTKTNVYWPIYEYTVNEHKYQKVYSNSSKSWIEIELPTGQSVKVYYDKNDPSQFAPEGSIDKLINSCVIVGLFFVFSMCVTTYLFSSTGGEIYGLF